MDIYRVTRQSHVRLSVKDVLAHDYAHDAVRLETSIARLDATIVQCSSSSSGKVSSVTYALVIDHITLHIVGARCCTLIQQINDTLLMMMTTMTNDSSSSSSKSLDVLLLLEGHCMVQLAMLKVNVTTLLMAVTCM